MGGNTDDCWALGPSLGGPAYGLRVEDWFAGSTGLVGSTFWRAGGPGGGGGGAIQISSAVRVSIGARGVVRVHGGGGGDAWADDLNLGGPGGGGGSGGTVFLEAPVVVIDGGLYANGGAGGGPNGNLFAQDGRDGDLPAIGNGGGSGGTNALPTGGKYFSVGDLDNRCGVRTYAGAGGGGGSAGVIWLRTRGAPAVVNGAIVPSPSVDTGL